MSYGCYNKPRPDPKSTYVVQDGYFGTIPDENMEFTRIPRYIKINHMLTTDCQYTKTTKDSACDGCMHQSK